MKIKRLLTISILGVRVLAAGQTKNINDFEIGISPFLAVQDAQRIRQQLVTFVLGAAPGSSIKTFDAYNLRTVAVFDIPRLKFDSPGNRARELARPLAGLNEWLANTAATDVPPELKGTAALKAPEWLEAIPAEASDHPRAILLIGSPLYFSTAEPAFSMQPDLYPGDGHLLANADQSIYGQRDNTQCLANVTVHWVYPGEQVWANDLQAFHVRRFWSLYVALRSGCLADMSADLNGVFSRLGKVGLSPIGRFEVERNDTKLTMRVARPREIPRWMPAGTGSTNSSAASAPTTSISASPKPSERTTQTIELPWQASSSVLRADRNTPPLFAVGLMWEQHADVDLYITSPGATELWFGNVLNSNGRYLHDFRDRNAGHDYEWVELWNQVDPAKVEAWVNYFEGKGSVRGTVCVYFQGKTYLSPFELTATSGNGGRERQTRDSSAYWSRLDIEKIIQQGPAK